MSRPVTHGRSERVVAAGIALLLFGLSIVIWSGDFHSSDGLSMYTAADSLVRYGRFDIEQIRWMDLQQGTYGPDGLLYSRKGLGTTILIFPFVLFGILLPGIGPVHAALLLPPLFTAATGALLYIACRRGFPEFPQTVAVLVALAWGLGSMALPYSKTLFSDPLVTLMMMGAFERLLAFRDAATEQALLRRGAGVGVWLGLGILTRAAHGIVAPVIGLGILWVVWRIYLAHASRFDVVQFVSASWRPVMAFVVPILVAGFLALWYNWLRFGDPLNSGYLPQESFSALWWRGVVGQLVSPGRGLLWYTPWLLLAVPAVWWSWRKAPFGTMVAGGSFLAYLLLYGKWYMWHGGFAWGPRFLVPTLPLLAWLAAPAAARWRRLFTGLVILSVGINSIGAVWDFAPHQQWLAEQLPLFDPRTFFELQYAQIPGVLRFGLSQPLDVVWMMDGRLHPLMLAIVLLTAVTEILAVIVAWRQNSTRAIYAGILILLAGTYALLWQARSAQPSEYHDIASVLAEQPASKTMIWHDDLEHTPVFLNTYKGSAPIVGANVTGDIPSKQLSERLPALAESSRSVWVLSDGPAPAANALDRAAMRQKGAVAELTLNGKLRATYYFDTDAWQPQAVQAIFTNGNEPIIRLVGVETAIQDEVAAIRLQWKAVEPVAEDYQIFVHLIGTDGERVAQDDGPAQNGLAPTSTWQPGLVITDTHALQVPADTPTGEYTFVVGLYRLEDLHRLTTVEGRDAIRVETLSDTNH